MENGNDAWSQCEALVEGAAWKWLGGSPQCARVGYPRSALAGISLCWQHEQKAERSGDLELTGGRTLVLDQEWVDEWTRKLVGVRIVANVTHLDRAKQERPGR